MRIVRNIINSIDKVSRKIAKALIRFYQYFLSFDNSPFLSKLGIRVCIYHPTCSQYTYEAIDKHGVIKGSIMGFFRILRCNPFYHPGHDPVPDKFQITRNS